MRRAIRGAALLSLTCAWVMACSIPGELSSEEEEVDLFSSKLSSGLSPLEACIELDALCQATGIGCKAYALFCGGVPSKQTICQKLLDACNKYGLASACQVYKSYCVSPCGGKPCMDAGMPKLDACPWGKCPPKLDAGMPKLDACSSGKCPPKLDAGKYLDAHPAFCGDKLCDKLLGESCKNCPIDCGKCPVVEAGAYPDHALGGCGNKVCEKLKGESCMTCPIDCGKCPGLDAGWPHADVAFHYCGDKLCDAKLGESCSTCPFDCGTCVPKCGNLICEFSLGETCFTCPTDCGKCVCGDKACNKWGESCYNCPVDCGFCTK